jgi:hypothetical protein
VLGAARHRLPAGPQGGDAGGWSRFRSTQDFADAHSPRTAQFLLAAGSAGIEAATNIVVKQANHTMLRWSTRR